jgi:transketolase N-terminal domain/subunit
MVPQMTCFPWEILEAKFEAFGWDVIEVEDGNKY